MSRSRTAQEFIHYAAPFSGKPVLAHSDLFLASFILRSTQASRELLLEEHVALIQEACDTQHLWFPLFNYDFPRTRVARPDTDPAQLGPLPEHYRSTKARWRTHVPIFSFGGKSPESRALLERLFSFPQGSEIDPFGMGSVFDELAAQGGHILLYGAALSSCTFIHHAERYSGGPMYRYDKSFVGHVESGEGGRTDVRLNYHVRPLGHGLEYDWLAIEAALTTEGILRPFVQGGRVLARAIPARPLREFWSGQLKRDPMSLLNAETRAWVEPKLNSLGRRFRLSDFEREVE